MINLAKPFMAKSSVVDSKTGKSTESRVRTSSGMFLKRGKDKIIQKIERRIADFTFIPVENGEGLQVLHYGVGEKYEPHYDYFLDAFNTKNGGQRVATVLMSDVEEGGETVFPAAKANFSSVPWWNDLSECARKGLSVKPKMGDALLFWSMRPDATLDASSLHAERWWATATVVDNIGMVKGTVSRCNGGDTVGRRIGCVSLCRILLPTTKNAITSSTDADLSSAYSLGDCLEYPPSPPPQTPISLVHIPSVIVLNIHTILLERDGWGEVEGESEDHGPTNKSGLRG
ncbi:prolyl 4-hydroxylase subunit alpha-1-like protein, partial [Trifolium pratense]